MTKEDCYERYMYNLKILGSISPYCKNDMNCPGYMIYNDKNKILLDCGFGVSRLLKFPEVLCDLTIILSHCHKDHYADLFAIKYAALCYKNLGLLKSDINVYIPAVSEDDECYLDYTLMKHENESYFQIHEYNEDSNLTIDDLEISFFETYHTTKNYSVKITNNGKSLVYSGDMGYAKTDQYIEFLKNVTWFLCECTFLEHEGENNKYHMHTGEIVKLVNSSHVKHLILTHLWPEHDKNKYLAEVKKHFENTVVARENEIFYDIYS